jgi:hypothetical protein
VGKAAYYGLMIGFLAVVISLITLVNELSGLDEAQRYFANAMVFLLAIFGYFQFFKDFDIDARNRRRNKTIEGVDVEKSEELQEFIHSTIESVKKGTPEPYYLHSDIDFEIAVISVKEAKGGFKLLVVDASGKYDKEATTRIKFSIREG